MPKLVVFTLDELKQCRGMDRAIALKRYKDWRESERKNDRRMHVNLRHRLYAFHNRERINEYKRAWCVEQKRKRYIRVWFISVDKYVEKQERVIFMATRISSEEKENKVLNCLDQGSKDRFTITAECGLNQNTVYLTLKVLEARGAILSTKLGKKTLWMKKPAVVDPAF